MARGQKAGEAFYRLSLDDKTLHKALRRTQAMVRSAAKAVAGLFSAGAAAAAAALTKSVVTFAKQADGVGKVAERLGLSAENLSKLQFAAKQSGLEVNVLNMALQRMTRRIAEAGVGKGEALGAIERLGLDPGTLATKTPDEQLRLVANALQNVGTQGERVRLAFKLFDSEGVKVLNMLQDGAAGLNELGRQAEMLGAVITDEQAADARDLNDAWGRMSASLQGLLLQVGGQSAPLLTSIIDRLTEVMRSMRDFGAGAGDLALILKAGSIDLAEAYVDARRNLTAGGGFAGAAAILGVGAGATQAAGVDDLDEVIDVLRDDFNRARQRLERAARDRERARLNRLSPFAALREQLLADPGREFSSAKNRRFFNPSDLQQRASAAAATSRSGFGVSATSDVFGTQSIGRQQLDVLQKQLKEMMETNELLDDKVKPFSFS